MAEEIKAEYEMLMKKFSLPKFDLINNEFQISLIEHKEFLIRAILDNILDKVDHYSQLLGQIFQPDTNSLSEMSEFRFIDDDEKASLFAFYKKIMRIKQEIIALSIEGNDKKIADFITNILKEWPSIKQRLIDLSKKLSDSWEISSDIKFNIDYLG